MFVSRDNGVAAGSSEVKAHTTIQDLPNEMCVEIFKILSLRDAASVFLTQKSWSLSQDLFEQHAYHLGFEGKKEEAISFLKGLVAEVKMACQNGDIPADFIVYQDADKTKISCQGTLLNLLSKEGIVESVFGVTCNSKDLRDEARAIQDIHSGRYNFFKESPRYHFLLKALLALTDRQTTMPPEQSTNSKREAFVLAVAAVMGSLEGIDLLLKWGVDANSVYEGSNRTPRSLVEAYGYTRGGEREQHAKTASFLEERGGKEARLPFSVLS